MSSDEKPALRPQLHMLRETLQGLPTLRVPEDYSLRSYHPGDAVHWSRIYANAFEQEYSPHLFDKIMRSDSCFEPQRIWFAIIGRLPVATASAYYNPHIMQRAGALHMVAVNPDHRGKKLGYGVCLAALYHMRRESRRKAWLSTNDYRLAAIKLYLNLDFRPLLVHENQRRRWAAVFTKLGKPELSERYHEILCGSLYALPVAD